ncbi:MAG: adenylate/guanylate cyclase domain-containing protein [Alphaproteobacteria bacterium]|nr:adenylate/guanylate cyclase domain-containing protein [Alphaproteobacteria bacterium]
MRAPAASADRLPVAIVAIDEETYRTPPFAGAPKDAWTTEIAQVLGAVIDGGASVVGFDVIFATTIERYNRGHDRPFLLALRQAAAAGKVVLGKVQHQQHPIEPFRGQLIAVGTDADRNVRSVNVFIDPDDVIRSVPLLFDTDDAKDGERETAMALELAARHLKAEVALLSDGRVRLGDRPIPGSEQNTMLLRFPAPLARLPVYSFADLAACAEDGARDFFVRHFAGRVVLLGTVLDVEDRKITSARLTTGPESAYVGARCVNPPMAGLFDDAVVRPTVPGVFIHATAVANLLGNSMLAQPPAAVSLALLLLLSLASTALVTALAPSLAVAAGAGVALTWSGAGMIAFGQSLVLPLVPGLATLALAFALALAYRIVVADREKRFLRRSFSLYLAPAVVDQLVASETPPQLGGETREITAYFSDLVGFSTLSETTPAEIVVEKLNAYFSAMAEIIEGEGGFVDKYVGDAIVAVFGAPVPVPDHAARAVRAALACQRRLAEMNATLFKESPIGQRIGLATGPAIVGNIGSGRKFNYTAIGDVMNVAARLEQANKSLGTTLLCTAATRASAGDGFAWREVDRITVRGRRAEVVVFEPSTPAS